MSQRDVITMNWVNPVKISPITTPIKKRKRKIPVAFREQIWLRDFGKVFQGKCPTQWCNNVITIFDFQSGHNIPESKGGPTIPDNLLPLCSRCNMSMGDRYTFSEWTAINSSSESQPIRKLKVPFWCCWC